MVGGNSLRGVGGLSTGVVTIYGCVLFDIDVNNNLDNMKRAAPRCDITPGTKNNLKGGAAHGEKDSICRH